ncbi:uncharacterized protein LOC129926486 [Biomphalaria glabrata]|uniref:Uncharacterized protein LOC129926486 n=1 Tax=Biomphalaria glabrata TaxID=6526 RepID=A0A9W3AHN1_BIOGL|nr:uncharacterized protein LOC129926486 [Biomphalaria glabrata]XP_055886787.1 uncharacterized protein LOC129926486 [Biomphalaria glabrata]
MALIVHVLVLSLIASALQVLGQNVSCPMENSILIDDRCFQVNLHKITWNESKIDCEANNSMLAEFSSTEQAGKLLKYYPFRVGYFFWVNIYFFEQTELVWLSNNETVAIKHNSVSQSSNAFCGITYYNDVETIVEVQACIYQSYYICMTILSTTTSVHETTTTSLETTTGTTHSKETTSNTNPTTDTSSSITPSKETTTDTNPTSETTRTLLTSTLNINTSTTTQIANTPESTTRSGTIEFRANVCVFTMNILLLLQSGRYCIGNLC